MFEDLRQLHELQQQAGAAAGATHWPSSSSWVCREGSPPIFSAGWTHQQVWSYSCGDSYHDTTTAASAASAALPLFHAVPPARQCLRAEAAQLSCAPLPSPRAQVPPRPDTLRGIAGPGAPVNIQRGPECTAGVPRRREDPEGCCSADVRPSCCRGQPQEAQRQHSAYGEHRSWRHLVASLLTRQSLICV